MNFFSNLPSREHSLLNDIPKPRVGYFGLFDKRTDQELLAEYARRMPDVSVVITGLVVSEISELTNLPTVYFTGPVPYKELPSMVKGWDACILPYTLNRLADTISHLKLKEHIATGKPVISTPLKEAHTFSQLLFIGNTAGQWTTLTKGILTGHARNAGGRHRRTKFSANKTGKEKTAAFLSLTTQRIVHHE